MKKLILLLAILFCGNYLLAAGKNSHQRQQLLAKEVQPARSSIALVWESIVNSSALLCCWKVRQTPAINLKGTPCFATAHAYGQVNSLRLDSTSKNLSGSSREMGPTDGGWTFF